MSPEELLQQLGTQQPLQEPPEGQHRSVRLHTPSGACSISVGPVAGTRLCSSGWVGGRVSAALIRKLRSSGSGRWSNSKARVSQ